MGRKQSTVTQYYEMTRDEQSKCQKARCKFCGWSSAKNTVRMKVHLAKTCTACPEPVKAVFAADLEESETESSSEESDQSGSGTALLETSRTSEKRRKKGQTLPKSRKKKKKHRLTATDRSILLQEEHQEIDRALADYLFAANLPLSTIENPYFVTFCKKLRPTYQLPTRHRVVTQSFLQSATPVSQVQQPMTTYYQTGGQETSNLASTSAGLSVPMMHAQGPHQVPGVISSPESQQPGTFHLVRITNTQRMRRAAAKPPLTIEQRHQEKLNNWKVRRILRMTQTRDQANQASCNMRVNFWTEVDCIAQNMLDAEMETRRIELELQRKRQDAAEHKRQEELRIMAEQELAEEDIREQKKRQAVEYATRARERFNKALSIEKKRRADERRWAEEITDSMKATRKDESQKSRQRAAQAREAVIPDTTLVSFAHRDSMIPRELLPQPTSVEKPKHLETIFSVSPLSPSRTVPEEVRSVATEDRTAGVTDQKQPSGPTLRPRPLKTRENIPQESQLSDRPKKPSKPVIPALVRDIETCTTPGSTKSESVDWSGSIIDLGKENIEPVHPAFSPWSYSSHSVVPLGGRRIQPVSTESIAISAQTSLDTSDSFRSFDSDTLRSVFQHPAVQLSPPKQPPHPHNLRPRRPARPPATTTTDQSTLPDSKTPTPKKKRPALRQVENLPTQPESDAKPPSRPARQKSAVSRPQNPADLLGDLQEVMRALQILDANVLGRDRHSFSMSASSGPLSTPESGGLYSNESWLSQQTLSCETSSSHMTYESGSLFTSHDESLESGPVDLSFLPGSQDVSGLSNGNLDELSGNDIDLL